MKKVIKLQFVKYIQGISSVDDVILVSKDGFFSMELITLYKNSLQYFLTW
jgi:negative regulator of genetic competence, sporulation and motility